MNPLILTLVATLAPHFAFANNSSLGSFAFEHEVAFGGGYTRHSCQKEKGRWDNGACYFVGNDEVEITESAAALHVKVNTIRTNGRECEFKGDAVAVSPTELLASAPTEMMVAGENEDEFKVVPAVCELKLTFLDLNTLKVEKLDAAKCADLCGTSLVGLDIPGAKRVTQ